MVKIYYQIIYKMHIIYCPQCGGCIEIESINCMIFRHAIYKDLQPYNPHASNEQTHADINNIYGCGVQFKYDGINEPYIIN